MMFENDLFSQSKKSAPCILAYFVLGEKRETLLCQTDKFKEVEDQQEADFFVDGEEIVVNGERHSLERIDLDSLFHTLSFYRVFKRDQLAMQTQRAISTVDLENEQQDSLYWKTLRLCIEQAIESDSLGAFLIGIAKITDLKKRLDIRLLKRKEAQLSKNRASHIIKFHESFLCFNIDNEEELSSLRAIHDFTSSPHFEDYLSKDQVRQGEDSLSVNSVLSVIDFPAVVISDLGVVLHYNDNFSRLNLLPSLILDSDKAGWLEYRDLRYKILKQKLPSNSTFYLLVTQNCEVDTSFEGQSELGIISGSIAHELNNPVAGILAALTLLSLEEWDEENIKMLAEMKESAMRCKGLIDTFLGFSKYRGRSSFSLSLGSVMEQSIALLRYRMVESGVSLQFKGLEEDKNSKVKATVLTMVFYLIFNEFLTIHSHLQLIDSGVGKSLDLIFLKEGHSLQIKFSLFEITDKEKEMINQKLISHLLDMEGVKMIIHPNLIEFDGIFLD